MAKPKDRTNAYWRARIERDHPEIFARLAAGEIATVRAARNAAGLLRQPTPLQQMMRAWDRLKPRDRNEFLRWAHATYRTRLELSEGPEPPVADDAQLTFL
jgi:hypothetical protein